MIGLIFLCLIGGFFGGLWVHTSWAAGAPDFRPDIIGWPAGGLVLVVLLALVGRWQANRGQKALGFSKSGYVGAIALSYLVGAIGGILVP
jgi:hypothetical protein